MKRTLIALAALTLAVHAHAAGLKQARVFQDFGPNDFETTDFSAIFSMDGAAMTPRYRRYSQKGVGSFGEASLQVGVESALFGFGLRGMVVPKASGYSAIGGGAELAFRLSSSGSGGSSLLSGSGASGPKGKGIARVDVGVGGNITAHKNDSTGTGSERKLRETEIYGFGRASIVGFELVGRFAGYSYDKDLKTASLPSTVWTPVWGHVRVANGYPETNLNLRGSIPFFPLVTPYAEVTYTTYKELAASVKPGDTKAFTVGAAVGLDLVAVEARYQVLKTNGLASQSYYGIGAQLRL